MLPFYYCFYSQPRHEYHEVNIPSCIQIVTPEDYINEMQKLFEKVSCVSVLLLFITKKVKYQPTKDEICLKLTFR